MKNTKKKKREYNENVSHKAKWAEETAVNLNKSCLEIHSQRREKKNLMGFIKGHQNSNYMSIRRGSKTKCEKHYFRK